MDYTEKWHRAEVSVDWELCSREREEREGDPGCDTGVVRDLRPEPAAGAESGEGTPVWRESGGATETWRPKHVNTLCRTQGAWSVLSE